MYALITFFVAGALADFVLEGPDVVRTALIITDQLMDQLGRGVTRWTVRGMYTQEEHAAIYCTVTRPEIKELKHIVAEADPEAFVIIGQGHEALGQGFRRLEARQPVVDELEEPERVDSI